MQLNATWCDFTQVLPEKENKVNFSTEVLFQQSHKIMVLLFIITKQNHKNVSPHSKIGIITAYSL